MLPNTRRLISNFDRKNAIGKRKTFITQDHPISVDPNPKKTFCLFTQQQTNFFYRCSTSFCGFGTNKKTSMLVRKSLKRRTGKYFCYQKLFEYSKI